MSREVRRVPLDWQHPTMWRMQWDSHGGRPKMQLTHRALLDRGCLAYYAEEGETADLSDFMPEFAEGTAVGWCMYETTSEGTPISPVMESPEHLARWLADNGASSFGRDTATYDQWLRTIQAGWAPSAGGIGGALVSGVEFVARTTS